MQRTNNPLTNRLTADAADHVIEGMSTWGSLIGELIQTNCAGRTDFRDCESILMRGAHDILHDLNMRPEFHKALERELYKFVGKLQSMVKEWKEAA